MSIATEEIRRRAIAAYRNGGQTQAQIAAAYNIDPRTFQQWRQRADQNGEYAPRTRGHPKAIFDDEKLRQLDQLVQQHPDATLAKLQALSGINAGIMTFARALKRLGYTFKKNAARQRTRPRRCPHPARPMA